MWDGETRSLGHGLTLIRCGRHFDGATVLHWSGGAGGAGALLSSDIVQVIPDRRFVSFMYSYPNLIPLDETAVSRVTAALAPFAFESIYGAWWRSTIHHDARGVIERSAKRYVRALHGEYPKRHDARIDPQLRQVSITNIRRPHGIERNASRALFVLVGALALSEVMFYSVLAPLLSHYTRQLQLSKGAAGLLSASYAIGTLLFAVPVGMFVARVGAKRATVCSAVLLACASVAFGLAHSLAVLDTARLVQGIAGAGVWTASLTWLVGTAPAHRRGEMVGAVLGIGIVGALLGPVIGTAAELTEPRIVFGAVALLILALAGWALATPGPAKVDDALAHGLLRAVGRDRRLLGGMWFTALPAALFGVLNVLVPLRLSALGAGTIAVGVVFFVSAAVEAAASPLFGRISDRRGPLPMIRTGLVGSALLAVLLPLPGVAWLVGMLTVLAGVTFGMAWVPASALLSAGADDQGLHPALAYALWNMAWAIGLAAGSAVGAPLAQATTDAVPYGLLAGLCVGTLVVIRGRRENHLALPRTR